VNNSMPFALLFPGQGAQYVGMGKEIFELFPAARALYKKADEVLDFPVSKICFEGPENQLNLTVNAQPAIFVTSLAIWEVIKALYPDCKPTATCGLSLGEFSALTAAGYFEFEQGLRVVRKRGEWMHEAGERNPGAMCSVIGLDGNGCEEVAALAGVQVANFNSPEQIVLSGNVEGIAKAMTLAKEKGAKKVIPLKVSGAFHSRLMAEAEEKLARELDQIGPTGGLQMAFIPNVLGDFLADPGEIRFALAKQVTHSVRWTQTVQTLHAKGFRTALEMGPGKVLKGLARRTVDDFTVHSVESAADVQSSGTVIHGLARGLDGATV